jgi:hypothetical protein
VHPSPAAAAVLETELDDTEHMAESFAEQGFVLVRNAFSPAEVDAAVATTYRAIEAGNYVGKEYPAPGKITVARNDWAEAGLANIAGHPRVLETIEPLLGAPAQLQAFVSYLRTPSPGEWSTDDDVPLALERQHHDGHGRSSEPANGGKHCDYKRWRPVGSSMNWVFVIIPLTDFDSTRPLFIAPGSHGCPPPPPALSPPPAPCPPRPPLLEPD